MRRNSPSRWGNRGATDAGRLPADAEFWPGPSGRCLPGGARGGGAHLPLRPALPRKERPSAHFFEASGPTHSSADPLPRRHFPSHPRRESMNIVELRHALSTLRLGGIASTLEARLIEAQSEKIAPLDFLSTLVADELNRRSENFIARRIKQARFRDADKSLDSFDFDFNKKMNRKLLFELATGQFISKRDALFLGPPGSGKSHIAQAIGRAAIRQHGFLVIYREAHQLLENLADGSVGGYR